MIPKPEPELLRCPDCGFFSHYATSIRAHRAKSFECKSERIKKSFRKRDWMPISKAYFSGFTGTTEPPMSSREIMCAILDAKAPYELIPTMRDEYQPRSKRNRCVRVKGREFWIPNTLWDLIKVWYREVRANGENMPLVEYLKLYAPGLQAGLGRE